MRWLAIAALVAACSGGGATSTPSETQGDKKMTTPMKPKSETAMVAGPAIEPSDALVAWLDEKVKPLSPRRKVRLPVAVVMDELSIKDASVGAIKLKLDDTGMGVALKDQLRPICQGSCTVWLEGYWGPLVQSGPQLPVPGGKKVFAVLAVAGVVEGPAATVLVEPPLP